MFDIGQYDEKEIEPLKPMRYKDGIINIVGKTIMGIVKIMYGESDLFEVVAALHSSSGFSGGLHGVGIMVS